MLVNSHAFSWCGALNSGIILCHHFDDYYFDCVDYWERRHCVRLRINGTCAIIITEFCKREMERVTENGRFYSFEFDPSEQVSTKIINLYTVCIHRPQHLANLNKMLKTAQMPWWWVYTLFRIFTALAPFNTYTCTHLISLLSEDEFICRAPKIYFC